MIFICQQTNTKDLAGQSARGGGVLTLAGMVWGNILGKNLLDFGGV